MLGSIRAASSSFPLRTGSTRIPLARPKASVTTCIQSVRGQAHINPATKHAISNPTLANMEDRWEKMPPREQAELWMQLRDRMKNDWHELTWRERQVGYWVAFGPHGPRDDGNPPGTNWIVFKETVKYCAIGIAIFFVIRLFARDPPRTLNAQWQEMTNDYLKKQKVEPITGVSAEGYKGKGMVQSPPRKGGIPEPED